MKFKSMRLASILLATAAIALSAVPSFSQSKSDNVTFFCRSMFDEASGKKIPMTIVWVPDRKGHIRLISWKSQYFNVPPEKRCDIVTQKFQQSYNDGRLNYLTYGEVKGYQVICAVANTTEPCNAANQLFTIKRYNEPKIVLERLVGNLTGTSSEPDTQNPGGKQSYISVNDYLRSAPIIDSPPMPR